MALTISRVTGADYAAGNKRYKVRDVTFDSSYPTGGESLVAADVDLRKIEQVHPHGPAGNSDGAASTSAVAVRYDHTNSKLQAFETGDTVSTPLDQVGNTESLANYRVRVTFVGF